MDILESLLRLPQMNPLCYSGRKKRRLKRKIVTMVFVSLCLFQSYFAQDEESQCETYASENCIQEVRLKIGKRSAEMRKSYTLSMFTSQENEEPVAYFDYVGLDFYNCDPASGYVCNKETETVFSVITPCTPITTFSFFAEGEKAIPCMSIQKEKSVSKLASDSNKPMDLQNDGSRNSHQKKNIIVVAVCIGVIIPGATAAALYLLLKGGYPLRIHASENVAKALKQESVHNGNRILSTYFQKKRSKNVGEDAAAEETSSLSEDKSYHIEMDYQDDQCTKQDDKTVTQELS